MSFKSHIDTLELGDGLDNHCEVLKEPLTASKYVTLKNLPFDSYTIPEPSSADHEAQMASSHCFGFAIDVHIVLNESWLKKERVLSSEYCSNLSLMREKVA